MLVELSLKGVVKEPIYSGYNLILKDSEKRYLQINIGDYEGNFLDNYINSVMPPRPMTHDLIFTFFSLTDAIKVNKIIIDSYDDGLYYAKLNVDVKGVEHNIDCRPSDAIAISLRLKTPIFAENIILDKCATCLDN